MSTATMTQHQQIDLTGTPRVPMGRLLRVELRKLTDTRAGMWLLIAIALVTAAVVTIMMFTAGAADLTYANFVNATVSPQNVLLPILGILAVTTEWTQRTGLVTFTLEPSRMRVVLAKLFATILFGLLAVVVALVIAAFGNLLGMAVQGGDGSWAFGAVGLRDVTLLQVMGVLQGVAFGMLFMNTAAAIVVYFVIPMAWSILFSSVAALADAAPWIDLGTASAPLFAHDMNGGDWARLGVAGLIWIVVPLLLGGARLLRRELK